MSEYEILRDYIKYSLKDEDVVKQISHMRIQFTHTMSEFYFFNIFFRILKSLGVDCNRRMDSTVIGDNWVQFYFIDFYRDGMKYTTTFNRDKLLEDIKEFNLLQGGMSMQESANVLVDIFISLLI